MINQHAKAKFQEMKRPMLILALMILSAALGHGLKPSPVKHDPIKFSLIENIPKHFGKWYVDESEVPVALDPATQEAVATVYSETVSRSYTDGSGNRMMLAVAYGNRQTTRLKTHRQEVCYSSQGFSISNIEQVPINILGSEIPATRLVAEKGERVEPMTYWFTMGDQVVQGHIQRFLVQLSYAVTGEIPDGYLVRVSSISRNGRDAYPSQDQFVNELLAAMPSALVERLIGSRKDK